MRWQLPASYFGFFLPAGVLLSYLPAFLTEKGLTPSEVGLVFSSVFAVKLVTGPLMTWWADAGRRQMRVLVVAAWASVVCASVLGLSTRFDALLACVLTISVCRNYFQSMLESVAASVRSAGGELRYGRMRAVGSASVCLGVLLFGGLWSAGASYQQAALPAMVLLSGTILVVCTRSANAKAAMVVAAARSLAWRNAAWPSARLVPMATVLVASTLLIGANGVFYSSATLMLKSRGFGAPAIAMLWLMTFGIEALGFALYERLRQALGAALFFAGVVALALLRWVLFADAAENGPLVLAFALHVASFSWTHAFCVQWIRELWPAEFAATGQAVYTACAHGIGMAGAAYIASAWLPTVGSNVYWIAASMTAAGAAVSAWCFALRSVNTAATMRTP